MVSNTNLILPSDKLETEINSELQSKLDQLEKELSIYKFENASLKKSLLTVQKNLADNLSKNRSTVDSISSQAIRLIQLKNEGLENLNKLKSSRELTSLIKDEIGNFISMTKEISVATNKIQTLSLQSKLLSFNASVEAARAGEAGKGFSIVAQEIQKLSENTASSLKEIELITLKCDKETIKISEKIEKLNEHTAMAALNSESHSKYISDAINETSKLSSDISHNNVNFFTVLAKLDHIIWKLNTYMSASEGKPVFSFVDHKNCRLGKWYEEGEGKKFYSDNYSYKQILGPHSNVHGCTKEIFNLMEQGEDLNLDKIFKILQNMELNSDKIFEYLDTLEIN
jgi:hypothetical protein